jgi:lipoprotein-anchoring transpeptidase ErfK/SrfK
MLNSPAPQGGLWLRDEYRRSVVAQRSVCLLCLLFLAATGVVTGAAPANAVNGCPTVPANVLAGVDVGYAAPPALVGSAAARMQGVLDPGGQPVEWFFEYGPTSAYGSCTAPVMVTGAGPVAATPTGLVASTTYHFRLVALGTGGTSGIAGTDTTFTTLPTGEIAQGTTVDGVDLGGLDAASATRALQRLLTAPARLQFGRKHWSVSHSKLGARLDIASAVATALQALPGQALQAVINVARARLVRYLTLASRRYGLQRPAVVRLVGARAVVRAARPGVAINIRRAVNLVVHYLKANQTTRLRLPGRRTAPSKSTGTRAKAVVVRLGAQTLTAYLNGKPVLRTPVTTGRPALPTPVGSYHIEAAYSPFTFVSPWPPGSPYWYPPTSVTWAMPFYDGDFLHNDPGEPANAFGKGSEYGPYASHGCVHVPHAAMDFLFHWLPIGATVVVARA